MQSAAISSVAEEDDGERPVACATQRPKRLQDEMDAADARLRQAAQNFSVEWKAFLAYAMKIKQETADFASFPDKNALEDLLLRSQSGLVMLREMEKRRQDKWTHVLPWGNDQDEARKTKPKPPRRRRDVYVQEPLEIEARHAAFCMRYAKFLRRRLRLCYCYLTRKRLVPTATATQGNERTILHRGMTKLLQQGLVTLQALETEGSSGHRKEAQCALRCLQRADIESYVRFLCLQQQYGVVFDRFLTRLRWLLKSHRYHIRQRMLDLCYQQQSRNVALPPAALLQKSKVSPTVSDGVQCPRFPLTKLQVENELRSLLVWLGIQTTGHAMAIKLRVEEIFAVTIDATTLGPSPANDCSTPSHESSSLITKSLLRSRWSLLQLGSVLEDVSPVSSAAATPEEDPNSASVHGKRPEQRDALLHNEWQLLQFNDSAYLKSRLDGQSKTHSERALVDMAKPSTQPTPVDKTTRTQEVEKPSPEMTIFEATGLTDVPPEELLDAFYTARFLVCRRKRQKLLRALNYLHFLRDNRRSQATKVAKLVKGKRTLATRSPEASGGADWRVEQRDGDYVVLKDRDEFIFDAAWRDLQSVEAFLLDIASIFIEKEQSLHIVETQATDQPTAATILLAIDRMQVLSDVYECESQFQHAKIDAVLQLFSTGFEFDEEVRVDYIGSLIESRPLIDLSHSYFSESFTSEALLLGLRRQLLQTIQEHKEKTRLHHRCHAKSDEEEWLHDQLAMEAFAASYASAEQDIQNEAAQLWLVATSVSEHHAMQQALLEKIILVWKTIVMTEVPTPLGQSLEGTRNAMLGGSAWCIALTPDLVSNASIALSSINSPPPFDPDCPVEETSLVEAVELLEWRNRLGREVYETRVLEEVYEFQRNFVHILESRKIDEASLFSCDLVSSDSSQCQAGSASPLTPLIKLFKAKADESRGKRQRTVRHKQTVRDWMEAALRERQDRDQRVHFDRELRVQNLYKRCLVDKVQYHDLVSREVVEFAATAPFFFLASAIARHDSSTHTSGAMATTNLRAVKWKYMDEIVDRIRQVAEKTCSPRFISLESLRDSLLEKCHFEGTDEPGEEVMELEEDEPIAIVVDGATLERLDKLCEQTCAIPRLVVELDGTLRPLRNEKKLMEDLFPNDVEGRCAFHLRSAQAGQTPSSALSSWLSLKLEQLQQDLQTQQEDDLSKGANRKPPAGRNSHLRRRLSTRRSSFLESTAEAVNMIVAPAGDFASLTHQASEDAKLLLEIPSTEQLLEWFVSPSIITFGNARGEDDDSEDRWEADQASLRALIGIYNEFANALSLLRVETSFGFHLYPTKDSIRRRANSMCSARLQSPSTTGVGLELFKGWQVALHRSLKRFHDRVLERFEPHVIAKMDLFAVFDHDDVRKRHQLMAFRWELSGVVHDLTVEWRQRIRCAAIGIMVESFAVCLSTGDGQPHHFREEQRSIRLLLCRELSGDSTENVALPMSGDELLFLRSHAVAESASLRGFWQLLVTTHDAKHLESLAEWLSMVFALIQDNASRQAQGPIEIVASETVKRYEELAATYRIFHRVQAADGEHLLGSDINSKAQYSREEAVDEKARRVSGTILRMQTPECVKAPASSQPVSLFSRVVGAVLDVAKMVGGSQHAASRAGGTLPLPTMARLTLHSEILRVRVTIQWIDDDISQMQTHYESFLAQKRKFHLHQQQRRTGETAQTTSRGAEVFDGPQAAVSFQKRILDFSPYYRSTSPRHSVKPEVNIANGRGEFIVPELEMVAILRTFTQETNAFYEQMLASETSAADKLEAQCACLRGEVDRLQTALNSQNQDEALKREMFAVDKSYALQFQLHRQRKEMALLENRLALEQQILKKQLVDEFEQRLSDMHVQLLAKQQQFDVYRQVMQHDLKQQLQAAQSHLVHQLVDQSGVMAIETKTSFLESLQGQAAQDQLQKENVALKQTILKLQTLYEMQEQTRAIQSERERVTQDTQRMREAQLAKENSHLQHQIGQLEAEIAKLSQDRTFHRIKLANLQKTNDAESQRRREAKIRSLSATYRRTTHAPDDLGEAPPEQRTYVTRTPNQDDPEEAFERLHAIKIRSPRSPSAPASGRVVPSAEVIETRRQDDSHLKNTTQHYQNEIKRLQQQLAREMKMKSALMEQVSQLKNAEASNNTEEGEEQGDAPLTVTTDTVRWDRQARFGLASASPRMRAASASVCSPRQSKPAVLIVPQRPRTSFSPRVKSAAPFVRPQSTTPKVSETLAASPSPAPSSNRKFDVQPREPGVVKIGGIAGVQNTLSAREKLPYR